MKQIAPIFLLSLWFASVAVASTLSGERLYVIEARSAGTTVNDYTLWTSKKPADASIKTLVRDLTYGKQSEADVKNADEATHSRRTVAMLAAQEGISGPIRNRIQRTFDAFWKYFENLGATRKPQVEIGVVPDDVPAVAYYDPDKRTVFID